jgi:hypothetical protein
MESIVKETRARIKKGLLSKDESEVEEAKERLSRLEDGVNALSGDVDDRRVSRIVKEIKAMEVGSNLNRKSSAYGDELKSLQQQLLEAKNSKDTFAFGTTLQQMQQLVNQMNQNLQNPAQQSMQAKQQGLFSQQDVSDYFKPYASLQEQLKAGGINSNLPNLNLNFASNSNNPLTMTDLASIRQNAINAATRMNVNGGSQQQGLYRPPSSQPLFSNPLDTGSRPNISGFSSPGSSSNNTFGSLSNPGSNPSSSAGRTNGPSGRPGW